MALRSVNLGKVTGADATINGQNTVTLNTDETTSGLKLTQSGSTLTLKGAPLLDAAKSYSDGKLSAHTSAANPHGVTKAQVGLGNVENKSSATIRSEITPSDISTSLGYVPQEKLTGAPTDSVSFDAAGNMITIPRFYKLFGFELDQTDSNPATCIRYLGDNANYKSAKMNFATGVFDYGDWADAWFIKGIKPVCLSNKGVVTAELNPNNYAQDKNGNPYAQTDTDNIMIGIPTVWYYVDTTNADKPKFWFSDVQVNTDFKAYAHINTKGEVIPYTYLPAYNGFKDTAGKMRSISGQTISRSLTASAEITAATANNVDGDNIWYTEVLSDRMLITLLLFLIGKSTNSQAVFGNGNMNGYNHDNGYSSDYGLLPTGTMDTKGLFWGSSEDNLGVKVFGIEHYWGNQWRRTAGYINDMGTQKIKMTWGKEDGSETVGYNTDGSGYISIGDCPAGNGSFISKMCFNEYGMYPAECSGSATTYYCDGFWSNNSQVNYALFGGYTRTLTTNGIYICWNSVENEYSHAFCGASVSCKPYLT